MWYPAKVVSVSNADTNSARTNNVETNNAQNNSPADKTQQIAALLADEKLLTLQEVADKRSSDHPRLRPAQRTQVHRVARRRRHPLRSCFLLQREGRYFQVRFWRHHGLDRRRLQRRRNLRAPVHRGRFPSGPTHRRTARSPCARGHPPRAGFGLLGSFGEDAGASSSTERGLAARSRSRKPLPRFSGSPAKIHCVSAHAATTMPMSHHQL